MGGNRQVFLGGVSGRFRLEAVAHQVLLLGDSAQADESKRLRTAPPAYTNTRVQIMVVATSEWARSSGTIRLSQPACNRCVAKLCAVASNRYTRHFRMQCDSLENTYEDRIEAEND